MNLVKTRQLDASKIAELAQRIDREATPAKKESKHE